MNSISQDCQQLKTDYDVCFNKWFREKFLKGSKKDDCAELFKSYQNCVKVNLRAVLFMELVISAGARFTKP